MIETMWITTDEAAEAILRVKDLGSVRRYLKRHPDVRVRQRSGQALLIHRGDLEASMPLVQGGGRRLKAVR